MAYIVHISEAKTGSSDLHQDAIPFQLVWMYNGILLGEAIR